MGQERSCQRAETKFGDQARKNVTNIFCLQKVLKLTHNKLAKVEAKLKKKKKKFLSNKNINKELK